jgi:hypothetical protein
MVAQGKILVPTVSSPISLSLACLLTSTVYHIHEKPVSDGDCNATGGHLDPTKRGESPPCDSSDAADCQVGDLSGIFGTCKTLSSCVKS